ncbi:uncharacterized protein LOC116515016 [Thamnophis elegans]|uniref:uncharacterized protein LOC116515016 n=1 Tax=Thamnophis elegans TaxID=35005 RepID=UPI001376C6DC|nr:uncharacterized protein LOC116515016 [Thamnophis elegans]
MLILAMQCTKCLILFSIVYKAQNDQFLFVDVGENATIVCNFSKNITDNVPNMRWYKREETKLRLLTNNCGFSGSKSKFNCKAEGQALTLEISNAKVEDAGLYLCADASQNVYSLNFAGAFSLIVGDSYTSSSWMMILQPSAQDQAIQSGSRLACVVHGASNWIQISWDASHVLQGGQTLLMKNHSGSLTFVSIIYIPKKVSISGEEFICKARFNSSGMSMKLSTTLYAETRTFHTNDRQHYAIPLSVVGILAFLLLIVIWLWIRGCPSRLGFQPTDSVPPALETPEEDICYADLMFHSNNQEWEKTRQTS